MNAPSPRAAAVRHLVKMHRAIGIAAKPRKPPRAAPPDAIRRDYQRALMALAARLRVPFEAALEKLRPIVERAAAEHRADADEGAAVRALIARLKQQFADAIPAQEVQDLAKRFAAHTSTYQRKQFAAQTKAALGVDVVTSDAKLARLVDNFVHANVALVTGIGPRLASDIESAALNAVQRGRLWPDLADDLRDKLGIAEDRARLIARDQIGKAYADIDQARQRDLGVTRFRWTSVHDDRVRGDPDGKYPKAETSHYALDGKVYAYTDPPLNADGEPILPGDEINCRCTAEPIWDDVLGDDNA